MFPVKPETMKYKNTTNYKFSGNTTFQNLLKDICRQVIDTSESISWNTRYIHNFNKNPSANSRGNFKTSTL